MHARLCRPATRRRGLTQGRGSAHGRTRAVSACSTRTTGLARSRQRALLCAAAQGQPHLIACDRHGARRVGRAVRGGRTGRCLVPACGGGPLPKARTSCPGCACSLELRRHSWHGVTSLLVPTSDRRDLPPSMEPVRHRNGAAASPKAARRARRAPEAGAAARERVLLVCLRGVIKSVLKVLRKEAKPTPRRCPWDRGQSSRIVRPPQDRPACTSRASPCL